MTVNTAEEAIRIWAGYTMGGGAPLGQLLPQGADRPPEMEGLTDEQQVAQFVGRIEGYMDAHHALFTVYVMGESIYTLDEIHEARMNAFMDACIKAIGTGFKTYPRRVRETECMKDEVDSITAAVNAAAESKYPLRWRQRVKVVEKIPA